MGKFFKIAGPVSYVKKKVVKNSKWAKNHPWLATGSVGSWVLSPGEELAHVFGVGDKIKDNTILDDFMPWIGGFPITPILYEYKAKHPERIVGTPEGRAATEKKWEALGQKGIQHSILAGY
jgi:hypothetical protein